MKKELTLPEIYSASLELAQACAMSSGRPWGVSICEEQYCVVPADVEQAAGRLVITFFPNGEIIEH